MSQVEMAFYVRFDIFSFAFEHHLDCVTNHKTTILDIMSE